MQPDQIFQIANTAAPIGWIILALSPLAPVWANRIGGVAMPIALSVLYAALILTYWSSGEGGFGTLEDVMMLSTTPGLALAGWTHYLAFDLAVGGWIVREAWRSAVPHWMVLPCLFFTLMFGPVGLLMFLATRFIRSRISDQATTPTA